MRLLLAGLSFALLAAACTGGSDEPLDADTAATRVRELANDIDWVSDPIARSAALSLGTQRVLADTLPSITEFPLVVRAPNSSPSVTVEIFVSSEKGGEDEDGWMVEVGADFNRAGIVLSDGSIAQVEIRKIASGTGYQFIASGKHVPAAYSPSNALWGAMAAEFQTVEVVRDRMVANVAGIVMKDDTAEELRKESPELSASTLIGAVIDGDVVMGYTNPFSSSTGLNFLLTVLDEFAEGDSLRLTDSAVASVFEEFQRRVPFIAITTLQIRESVESDTGTLDAFVMEWQTFVNTDSLRSGFEFIPFGVAHDNPLYAIGELSSIEREALEAFATFSEGTEYVDLAEDFGFDPPAYTPAITAPSGSTLINAQNIWKEKKDGGRPVAVVFVADTSGSMSGTRINALRSAMQSAAEFVKEETKIGVVEFSDVARLRLELAEFGPNQQAKFQAVAEDLDPAGGTAMYDGVILGLDMLLDEVERTPNVKPMLVVLTDGETAEGLEFDQVDNIIQGVRIPVFTVGFEADIAALQRLSSLVEAASINADEDDIEFKMAGLFNAGG